MHDGHAALVGGGAEPGEVADYASVERDEVIAKARDLTVPVLGRDTSMRLIETVFDMEKVTDIRSLRRLLQRG